jgi:Mrp family chromosome partitioning ATPase
LAKPHHAVRTLVVTSAAAREGKTFVACNLAIALAQSGKRVLLTDTDLRRPTVHSWFGVPNDRGFVDALLQDDEAARGRGDIAGAIASGVDNLWLLPAGNSPPNPAELLGSTALPRLIGPVADTLLVANQAHGSLLVARCGRTRRTALHGALSALSGTGRPVIGVVLNDERPDALARFSRYDYYHHGYWSDATIEPSDRRTAALVNGTPGPI